jgi:hypothetical protein
MTEPIVWHKDEAGVLEGALTGGDWQEGDGFSIRFLPTGEPKDGLYAFVEENWYAERVEDPKDSSIILGYQVTCQTQYQICDDPSLENEVWSTYEHEQMGHVYDTVDQARAVAKHEADGSDPEYILWDGRIREHQ